MVQCMVQCGAVFSAVCGAVGCSVWCSVMESGTVGCSVVQCVTIFSGQNRKTNIFMLHLLPNQNMNIFGLPFLGEYLYK